MHAEPGENTQDIPFSHKINSGVGSIRYLPPNVYTDFCQNRLLYTEHHFFELYICWKVVVQASRSSECCQSGNCFGHSHTKPPLSLFHSWSKFAQAF